MQFILAEAMGLLTLQSQSFFRRAVSNGILTNRAVSVCVGKWSSTTQLDLALAETHPNDE